MIIRAYRWVNNWGNRSTRNVVIVSVCGFLLSFVFGLLAMYATSQWIEYHR